MQSTYQPRLLPRAITDSVMGAAFGAWGTLQAATADYWLTALSRRATPLDVAHDLANWTITMADRQRPTWTHENAIVREWPLARLRDYSAPDADPTMVATVILPPQAGHNSSVVDFGEGQSQVVVARENGCSRIFALDWVGATADTKDATVEHYVELLSETAELLGGKVNLVGDCQGGWLATIFAALHPEKVNSLAIAGAPIDFHAGEPLIHAWLSVMAPDGDLSYFRSAVATNGGVLPGRFLLDGFKMLQPDSELTRSVELLANIRDIRYLERYRRFENWFQWTQPLPGEYFLWIVENLFVRNSLIKGELVVAGQTVNLAAIDCPLFLMAGKNDHITPADQVWALADHVTTPIERVGRHSAKGGHLGLFMSHDALATHWPVIFSEMAALSTVTPDDDPPVLVDEPRSNTQAPVKTSAAGGRAVASKAPVSKPRGSKSLPVA